MYTLSLVSLFALAASGLAQGIEAPDSANKPSRMWQDVPGNRTNTTYTYSDGYVMGNGRMGFTFFGQPAADRLVLNEDSFWSGGLMSRINPNGIESIATMQEMIRNGNVTDAAKLATQGYIGTPVSTRHYEPLGYLSLVQEFGGKAENYERWLDTADSTAGVYFEANNVTYKREYLASFPGDIMAVRYTASKPGSITMRGRLNRGNDLNKWQDYAHPMNGDMIVSGGASGSMKPIEWAAGARVVASGGNVSTIGDWIKAEGADELTVYVSVWTSFRRPDPRNAVIADLMKQTHAGYESVKTEHIADYQELYNRFNISLGESSPEQREMPTAARMTSISNSTFDPELVTLYLQFGRYLLIACSREGSLPANLQGIWNDNFDPMWGSKFTVNINLQMNYWHSHTTGLGELNSPLWPLLRDMHREGTRVAKEMYGLSGTVTHHNTDLWGDSAPQDNYAASLNWNMGGVWMCLHIYEYYQHTGDKAFLAANYDIIKDNAQFALDYLTPYNGYMVTNPSSSPENNYYDPITNATVAITLGPTMDNSLLWELFGVVAEVDSVLGGADQAFVQQVLEMRSKLPPLRTNQYDALAEWIHDFEETTPGQSHVSHLWGIYPGSQLTPSNPSTTSNDTTGNATNLYEAAQRSLQRRLDNGGGACGWPRAWTIALLHRFQDPEQANEYLITQLNECMWNSSMLNMGGTYPFQIDGNFGTVAAVVEALVWAHETASFKNAVEPAVGGVAVAVNTTDLEAGLTGDVGGIPVLRLLPSLSSMWAENGGGSVQGLRAKGGFVVDLAWDGEGKLTEATVTSVLGGDVIVTIGTAVIGEQGEEDNENAANVDVEGVTGGFVWLKSVVDGVYTVKLA